MQLCYLVKLTCHLSDVLQGPKFRTLKLHYGKSWGDLNISSSSSLSARNFWACLMTNIAPCKWPANKVVSMDNPAQQFWLTFCRSNLLACGWQRCHVVEADIDSSSPCINNHDALVFLKRDVSYTSRAWIGTLPWVNRLSFHCSGRSANLLCPLWPSEFKLVLQGNLGPILQGLLPIISVSVVDLPIHLDDWEWNWYCSWMMSTCCVCSHVGLGTLEEIPHKVP